MYLLGYDIGSSSIKAALVEVETGATLAVAQSPATEMGMVAHQPGWAEQDPEEWWLHVCAATKQLLENTLILPSEIKGIGISYQMHGLVVVGDDLKPLRPAIIWCDSRAVPFGNRAFDEMGQEHCRSHLLNSPGNFTAAKLAWVKENEPAVFAKIRHFMLPGDYIALRLTGEAMTTPSGLSEGILWDFIENDVAGTVLDYFGFDRKLVPQIAQTFSLQGKLTVEAAVATGLAEGTPVAYRAGDQPNNALSLNVLQPGEVAATGGTSGVVYGVVDRPAYDLQSRVNGFVHVNSLPPAPSQGGGVGTRNSDGTNEVDNGREAKRNIQGFETADPMKYKLLKGFVEENRRTSTQAEEVLWGGLRGKQLDGYKFRRQHIIDSFIADFVCLSKQLIIELDGKYHQLPEMVISDAERTERLNLLGFDVLRFTNDEVLVDIEGTLNKILERLKLLETKSLWFQKCSAPKNVEVPSPYSPSLGGGRGEAIPSPLGGGWEGALRIGILLCINGAGSLYRWLRQTVGQGSISYPDMERLAASVPVGADGLRILPFGNGAERMLNNLDLGAQINGLQLNRHTAAHLYRAGLEGIAFSFVYGVQVLKEMGLDISVMRVGNDNLFQSAVFSKTIATLLNCSIEVVQTTGAVGAAKAAGVATGIYPDIETAMASVTVTGRYEPEPDRVGEYRGAYERWEGDLRNAIAQQ